MSFCLAALGVLQILAGAFFWFTPNFTKTVPTATIALEQGWAYIAPVPPLAGTVYVLPSDRLGLPGNSSLTLMENGVALGPPHSLHDSIRKLGGGRYSHWHGSIIFSTPDGSDPRSNGRIYGLKSPTRVAPKWKIPLILFLLVADAVAFRVFRQEIAACWIRRRREIGMLSSFAVFAVTALATSGSFQHRLRAADVAAMAMAASLPWSTTIFGIFTVLWLICLVYVADRHQFAETLRRPECFLPVAIFVLAAAGMFWSSGPWAARIHIAGTMVKLLAVPALIYQFERSERGAAVFFVFLLSCTVLLALSCINWLEPRTILFKATTPGVPIKNWITQGVEFILCFFGSLVFAAVMWRNNRPYASLGLLFLAVGFLFNLVFVAATSRTSLVSFPVLIIVATFRNFSWHRSAALYGLIVILVSATWFASPALRYRLESIRDQYTQYAEQRKMTSVGLRLEYWRKSLQFISGAPLAGQGTGSIRGLFESRVVSSADGEQIVANPHNQTLYFAIEWGVIGIILLWTMWIVHFKMFFEMRWISLIGMIAVSQNIIDSVFNSHLSDYVEGWIYVMAVGIAGGVIAKPPHIAAELEAQMGDEVRLRDF